MLAHGRAGCSVSIFSTFSARPGQAGNTPGRGTPLRVDSFGSGSTASKNTRPVACRHPTPSPQNTTNTMSCHSGKAATRPCPSDNSAPRVSSSGASASQALMAVLEERPGHLAPVAAFVTGWHWGQRPPCTTLGSGNPSWRGCPESQSPEAADGPGIAVHGSAGRLVAPPPRHHRLAAARG